MRKPFGNNIDQLFRKKLGKAEVTPSENSWAAIEAELAKEAMPGNNFSKYLTAISAAVVLLITIYSINYNFTPLTNSLSDNIIDNINIPSASYVNSNKQIDFFEDSQLIESVSLSEEQISDQIRGLENIKHKTITTFEQINTVAEKLAINSSDNLKEEAHLSQKKEQTNVEAEENATIQAYFFPDLNKIITSDSENKPLNRKFSEVDNNSIDNNIEEKINERNQVIPALELEVLCAIPLNYNENKNKIGERFFNRKSLEENRFYVGLVYEYNTSWQKLDLSQNYLREIDADVKTNMITGHAYGFSAHLLTKKNWELEAQYIVNSSLGGSSNFSAFVDETTINTQHNVKYTYSQFPLLLKKKIHFPEVKNFFSRVHIGIVAGMKYSVLKQANVNLASGIQYGDIRRSNEIGFISGLEMDFHLNKSFAFRIGGKITASNRPDALFQFHNNNSRSAYNMQAGITTGLIFRLK